MYYNPVDSNLQYFLEISVFKLISCDALWKKVDKNISFSIVIYPRRWGDFIIILVGKVSIAYLGEISQNISLIDSMDGYGRVDCNFNLLSYVMTTFL